ncbi:nucleoside deaminase [Deinococcus humi]|uniref:tRNA(Arg) A34 adenosine deaminase TadA n=1 Tax=Deinococcus humi TaxID=662880 RepID=A0A7W8JVE7_9DEIO|nr:nucleoside deaminase [Deinococcus humi]MBB5362673.1 tRNA(Arg) A34 adenosine deaminase TadA [Deinococcus humi]GGO31169.1 tRNA-specific adenosine deaminase [Deinococcus humi]
MNDTDRRHLTRCVELAETALQCGNDPFGSLIVSGAGEVLFEDQNRTAGGDATQHPEFAIARWAAAHLSPQEWVRATVYTSGEHCAMCSAAHGWVGLGRIVYASSSRQLTQWMDELGMPAGPVKPLAIGDVLRDSNVEGPEPSLSGRIRELHERNVRRQAGK